MSPTECRRLAAELRNYGERYTAYRTRAFEAADRLEALAAEQESSGTDADNDADPPK